MTGLMTGSYRCRVVTRDDPPALRAEPFWRMQDEGLATTVFYDVAAPAIVHWHAVTGPDVAWLVRIETEAGDLVAVAWLTGFTGRCALTHFCVFRAGQPDAVRIGLAFVRWAFDTGHFDSLAGITPATYRHALRYITALGFTVQGRLPGAYRLVNRANAAHPGGRCVPGIISVITPHDLTQEETA